MRNLILKRRRPLLNVRGNIVVEATLHDLLKMTYELYEVSTLSQPLQEEPTVYMEEYLIVWIKF